jgi:hypothetical protein
MSKTDYEIKIEQKEHIRQFLVNNRNFIYRAILKLSKVQSEFIHLANRLPNVENIDEPMDKASLLKEELLETLDEIVSESCSIEPEYLKMLKQLSYDAEEHESIHRSGV